MVYIPSSVYYGIEAIQAPSAPNPVEAGSHRHRVSCDQGPGACRREVFGAAGFRSILFDFVFTPLRAAHERTFRHRRRESAYVERPIRVRGGADVVLVVWMGTGSTLLY